MNAVELMKRFPILRFFAHEHLPPNLREVSQPFATLAFATAERSSAHVAEQATVLRKLLEAKDAAVRAALPSE